MKVSPKEYWVRGGEGGGVGDKDVATGALLVKEHFLSQLLDTGGEDSL